MSELLVFLLLAEVARHRGIAQNAVDPLGIIECGVDAEAEIRHESHVEAGRDEAADVAAVAVEELEKLIPALSLERPHIGGRQSEIRRHHHFEHADPDRFECRIAGLPAQEDLRQRVADQFAGAKLALAWRFHVGLKREWRMEYLLPHSPLAIRYSPNPKSVALSRRGSIR